MERGRRWGGGEPRILQAVREATWDRVPIEVVRLIVGYASPDDRLAVRLSPSDPVPPYAEWGREIQYASYNEIQVWSVTSGLLLEHFCVPRHMEADLSLIHIPETFYDAPYEWLRPSPKDGLPALDGLGLVSYQIRGQSRPGTAYGRARRISVAALAWHTPETPDRHVQERAAYGTPAGRPGWLKLPEIARIDDSVGVTSGLRLLAHVVLLPRGRLLVPCEDGVQIFQIGASSRVVMGACSPAVMSDGALHGSHDIVPRTLGVLDPDGRWVLGCSRTRIVVWPSRTHHPNSITTKPDADAATTKTRVALAENVCEMLMPAAWCNFDQPSTNSNQWFEFVRTGLPDIYAHLAPMGVHLYHITVPGDGGPLISPLGRRISGGVHDEVPIAMAVAPGRLLVRTPDTGDAPQTAFSIWDIVADRLTPIEPPLPSSPHVVVGTSDGPTVAYVDETDDARTRIGFGRLRVGALRARWAPGPCSDTVATSYCRQTLCTPSSTDFL